MYVSKHKWFGLFWKIKDEPGSSRRQAGGKAGPMESLVSHAGLYPVGTGVTEGHCQGLAFWWLCR